jgi:hypothetical protein
MVRTWCAFVLACVVTAAAAAQGPAGTDPDALYRQREDPASAARAADLWAARSSTDYEAAWKLARVLYWIGTHGDKSGQRSALERGVKAGEQAVRLRGNRPEGHFWLAANMGRLAESFGMTQGVKYRGRIKSELELVLAIDASWEPGFADDALGQWYATVPRLFGGSLQKAEQHFEKALAADPTNLSAVMSLAQLRLRSRKNPEARVLLQRIIDAPLDPEWAPEERAFKREAAELLKKVRP